MPNPLPPGPELDRLIAEKVMGWRLVHCETGKPAKTVAHYKDAANNDGWAWEGGDGDDYAWKWQPSANVAQAFEVLAKFDGWSISNTTRSLIRVELFRDGEESVVVRAPTTEEAICLAALAATTKGAAS